MIPSEDQVEKIQDLLSCEQHEDKISTLVLETTNNVDVWMNCVEKDVDSKVEEDMNGFHYELNMNSECVNDLNVCDFDYGLIINMIAINPLRFSNDRNESTKECERRLKKDEGSRVDVKHKSTQNKVFREKMFEVDESLDSENSRVSYFQVRMNDGDKTHG
ncbi:hypothetical protein Tco_0295788 [Tanacetum coccineum]